MAYMYCALRLAFPFACIILISGSWMLHLTTVWRTLCHHLPSVILALSTSKLFLCSSQCHPTTRFLAFLSVVLPCLTPALILYFWIFWHVKIVTFASNMHVSVTNARVTVIFRFGLYFFLVFNALHHGFAARPRDPGYPRRTFKGLQELLDGGI